MGFFTAFAGGVAQGLHEQNVDNRKIRELKRARAFKYYTENVIPEYKKKKAAAGAIAARVAQFEPFVLKAGGSRQNAIALARDDSINFSNIGEVLQQYKFDRPTTAQQTETAGLRGEPTPTNIPAGAPPETAAIVEATETQPTTTPTGVTPGVNFLTGKANDMQIQEDVMKELMSIGLRKEDIINMQNFVDPTGPGSMLGMSAIQSPKLDGMVENLEAAIKQGLFPNKEAVAFVTDAIMAYRLNGDIRGIGAASQLILTFQERELFKESIKKTGSGKSWLTSAAQYKLVSNEVGTAFGGFIVNDPNTGETMIQGLSADLMQVVQRASAVASQLYMEGNRGHDDIQLTAANAARMAHNLYEERGDEGLRNFFTTKIPAVPIADFPTEEFNRFMGMTNAEKDAYVNNLSQSEKQSLDAAVQKHFSGNVSTPTGEVVPKAETAEPAESTLFNPRKHN